MFREGCKTKAKELKYALMLYRAEGNYRVGWSNSFDTKKTKSPQRNTSLKNILIPAFDCRTEKVENTTKLKFVGETLGQVLTQSVGVVDAEAAENLLYISGVKETISFDYNLKGFWNEMKTIDIYFLL